MLMSKLVIIDADSLVYHSSKENIYDSIEAIDEKIWSIFEQTETDQFYMFLSQGPYFRTKVNVDYKANRKTRKEVLRYIKTLKAYLRERWGAFSFEGLEADDLVAYVYMGCLTDRHEFWKQERPETNEVILCSTDKDLLNTYPGKHFNYSWKMLDKGTPQERAEKGRWISTVPHEALRFFLYQLLKGDSGDNIKGITDKNDWMKQEFKLDNRTGFGDLSVEKVLDSIILEPNDRSAIVRVMGVYYMWKGLEGISEFYKTYRQVKLLDTPEAVYRELGYNLVLPIPHKVEDFKDQVPVEEREQKNAEPLF